MRLSRPIVLILLVLAWLPATNLCAYAVIAPSVFAHCADDDDGADTNVPCNNRCANCVTSDNGSDMAGLQALTAPQLILVEDATLSEVVRVALAWTEKDAEEVVYPVLADDRPPWPAVCRTVPPVRGPSIA